MNAYLIAALSLGFLSSLHCLGMCGPIALALPLNRHSLWTMLGGLTLNNFSRITGYSLMGLIAGGLGKGLAIAGLQSHLSVLSGVMMLLVLFFYWKPLPALSFTHLIGSKWKTAASRLFGISSSYTLSIIGFLNAFLPCGFVYMALAGATGTGDIWKGAVFMALFGTGTIPALITVAFAKQFIQIRFREKARKYTPLLVSILACILIVRGLNLGIPYLSPKVDETSVHTCCHK